MPALPYRLLSPPPSSISISSLLARLLFGFSHFLTFLTFSIYLGVPDSGSWIPLHLFAFGFKPLFQLLIFTIAIHLGTPDLAAGLVQFFSFFSFWVSYITTDYGTSISHWPGYPDSGGCAKLSGYPASHLPPLRADGP